MFNKNILQKITVAILTPFVFSYRKGHFKSAIQSKALDRLGEALPWFSYSIIDFLRYRDFKGKSVLEFGAGQSTIWWKSVGANVTSLEINEDWYRYLQKQVPDCDLHLIDDKFMNIPKSVKESRYDVIVVDGGDRFHATEIAITLVANNGIIIFDNADERESKFYTEVPEMMYREGWKRVDFYGFAPGAIREVCTSIYWKTDEFFSTPKPPPMSADRITFGE